MAHRLYAVYADAYINRDFGENRREYDEVKAVIDERIQQARDMVDTEREREILDDAVGAMDELIGGYESWLRTIEVGNIDEIRRMDARFDHLRDAYAETVENIEQSIVTEMHQAASAFKRIADGVNTASLIVLFLAVGAAIALSIIGHVQGYRRGRGRFDKTAGDCRA
jgi:hypothetical protein